MAVLNMVLKGNEIMLLTRRISCDFDQFIPVSGVYEPLPGGVGDMYKDYIYCEDQDDLNGVKSWLDSHDYDYGTDEDLTPPSGIVEWLSSKSNTGQPGTTSKSDIYDKLKVVYPDQICVDARL